METARETAGERFVPGQSSARIRDDHVARYAFASAFAPGRRALDIACGTGYGTKLLHDAGAQSVCRRGHSHRTPSPDARMNFDVPGTRFAQADICSYGEDNAAELICCFETSGIEHIEEPAAALRNLRRLLDPDGTLVISSPNRPVHAPRIRSMHDRPPSLFHICEFTPTELRGLLTEAGFNVQVPIWGQRFSPRMPALGASRLRTTLPPRRSDVTGGTSPAPLGVSSLLHPCRGLKFGRARRRGWL